MVRGCKEPSGAIRSCHQPSGAIRSCHQPSGAINNCQEVLPLLLLSAAPVRGRHSGSSVYDPHNDLAQVLRRMPFLTQPWSPLTPQGYVRSYYQLSEKRSSRPFYRRPVWAESQADFNQIQLAYWRIAARDRQPSILAIIPSPPSSKMQLPINTVLAHAAMFGVLDEH